MLEVIYRGYAYVFGKKIFNKFNKFIYNLSLRGLGMLNYQNDYLTGEKDWLKDYLKNKINPTVIDVGANIGQYSLNILEANPNSLIVAFEPHPVTYEILCKNISNNKVELFNLGVGANEGILKLYDYDTNEGSQHASLYKEVITDIHQSNIVSYDVEIVNLDNFLTDKNIKNIDLLKIDTEGNELNVLVGIRNYLQSNKIKAIHFEFNEMNIISKSSFKNFWDLLPNYTLNRLLPGGELLEIKNYSPLFCEIYAFQNIIAILKDEMI